MPRVMAVVRIIATVIVTLRRRPLKTSRMMKFARMLVLHILWSVEYAGWWYAD